MEWQKDYESKLVSVKEAASKIISGDDIWVQAGCSMPVALINAINDRHEELENVDMYDGLTFYPFEHYKPELKGSIGGHTWFPSGITRKFKPLGNVEFNSVHLSKLWKYVENVAPTVSLCEVSPPDEDGYMYLGPFGVMAHDEGAKTSDRIIVQVNKNVPSFDGKNHRIHVSEVTCICEDHHELLELPEAPATEEDLAIAKHILPLIPDGATIQLGIGGTANAVGYGLKEKKDLGLHTEMLTDSLVYLAKIGVLNNSKKNHNPGKMLVAFGAGSKELYEFMDTEPSLVMQPTRDINDPLEIAKNDNMISINSALSVELTGQVSSESIGLNQFSATGGQLDFVRGATMSKGGKAFLCLPSTVETKSGRKSRIVLSFVPGTAVTVPRTDAQYIVTEYGVADVSCKSIKERAKAIISIAHPDYREELTEQAVKSGLFQQ